MNTKPTARGMEGGQPAPPSPPSDYIPSTHITPKPRQPKQDPFDQYDDARVWQALERAHMARQIRALPHGLDSEVEEGGKNFRCVFSRCLSRVCLSILSG